MICGNLRKKISLFPIAFGAQIDEEKNKGLFGRI